MKVSYQEDFKNVLFLKFDNYMTETLCDWIICGCNEDINCSNCPAFENKLIKLEYNELKKRYDKVKL